MDRTAARGLRRTLVRLALISAAFSLLVPSLGEAASVTLEWDRNSDGLTAGYYVYYGTESGKYAANVDVGSSTTAVVNLNDPNATYYFAVQAYSATGEKSGFSTEVMWLPSGTPSGQSPTLSNPGSMSTVVGQSVNLQLTASDPGGLALTYSVSGLPSGLVLGGTGVISGIPTAPGGFSVNVRVTNANGLFASQSFTWTILSQPSSTAPGGSFPGTGGGSGTGGGGTISDGGLIGGTPTGGGTPIGGGTPLGGGTPTAPTGGGTPETAVPIPTPDLTPPNVVVNSPSGAGGTSRTTDSKVIVTGGASDNVGVVSITWASSRGGSGAAFGTTSWATAPIDLSMGDNVITITAADAAGNVRTVTLTVTRYVDLTNFVN